MNPGGSLNFQPMIESCGPAFVVISRSSRLCTSRPEVEVKTENTAEEPLIQYVGDSGEGAAAGGDAAPADAKVEVKEEQVRWA